MTSVDRVVLLTGAARGIGRLIAERIATPGTGVVLADVLEDHLDEARGAIEKRGAQCISMRVDVTQSQSVADMVRATTDRFGRIDALFNNAGVIDVQPFMDATEEDWDRTMDVNAKGVFLCGQAVARVMIAQCTGRIVNTASVAARVGVPDMVAYAASKAAVMSVTRSMALALAPHGITVNALAPGIVATDMWTKIDAQRGAQKALAPGAALAERVAAIPLGRAATPDDIAGVAEFLISDAAAYVTGQTINIDGGMRHD